MSVFYTKMRVLHIYSGPSLIRPPYLSRNCGHIREVAFDEGEKLVNTLIVVVEKVYGLIREGGLC